MIAVINAAGAWVAALVALYSATVARRAAREARASMWQVATLTAQAKSTADASWRAGPSIGPLIVIPDDDPVYRQLDEDEAADRDH